MCSLSGFAIIVLEEMYCLFRMLTFVNCDEVCQYKTSTILFEVSLTP